MEIRYLLTALILLFLFACGGGEDPKQSATLKGAEPYTWEEMQGYCFSCHNSNAPEIPLDEANFKDSPKVRARTEDGTMPPASAKRDFEKERALAYFDATEETKTPGGSGGGTRY